MRRPPRSTLFPTRRSSDLSIAVRPLRLSVPLPLILEPDSKVRLPPPLVMELPPRSKMALLSSEEHTSELQSRFVFVWRVLLVDEAPAKFRSRGWLTATLPP